MQPHNTTNNIVEISLNQGKIVLIDAIDLEYISKHTWTAWFSGWKWYAITSYPRPKIGKIYMHRYILDAPKGIKVDHKNLNGLDNRRDNLRLATNQQNSQNKGPNKNNTSGYKGVARYRDKWQAGIKVNYRRISIGHFDTAIEAAKAYDAKAIEYFGSFAWLNFPDEH